MVLLTRDRYVKKETSASPAALRRALLTCEPHMQRQLGANAIKNGRVMVTTTNPMCLKDELAAKLKAIRGKRKPSCHGPEIC